MSLEKIIEDKICDLMMKIDKQKLPKHIAIILVMFVSFQLAYMGDGCI